MIAVKSVLARSRKILTAYRSTRSVLECGGPPPLFRRPQKNPTKIWEPSSAVAQGRARHSVRAVFPCCVPIDNLLIKRQHYGGYTIDNPGASSMETTNNRVRMSFHGGRDFPNRSLRIEPLNLIGAVAVEHRKSTEISPRGTLLNEERAGVGSEATSVVERKCVRFIG